MKNRHTLSAAERRRRDRRVWRTGLLISVVLHLLVFLLWRHTPVPLSPFAAAGPRAGDDRAASGSLQALALRSPPARTVVPPPDPVVVAVEVEPVEFEPEPQVDVSGLLGEAPEGPDPAGMEDGTGEGDGGTTSEGLNRLIPPSPRGMIIPPANEELRGKQVEVWVFVDERGRVVPDSTVLRPPTSDKDFNRRLIREAAEWVFVPARKGGEPVATWFPYTISM